VLAVRVIAGDNTKYGNTEAQLSDFVFGNGNDPVNLQSQYKACSYNQLNFNKVPNKNMVTPSGQNTNIANGVVTIEVATLPSEGDGPMRNAITAKINEVFGQSASSLATHVMYCLPPNTMSGIAYAYINSWNSVYSNQWCNFVSAQMHEIGHNLGFAHSNEGGTTYADQTGMMGYSYGQSDTPVMCFNGAKSFQTDWYISATEILTPTQGTPGTNRQTCFVGGLHGIAEYDQNDPDRTVLIKLNDSRSGQPDYFINFNRKTGINSGTVEGGNQVTITSAGEEGEAYAESNLLAKLSAGGSYTIANFEGTGNAAVITVESINTGTSPAVANVRIEYAGVSCDGTPSPTPAPTPCTVEGTGQPGVPLQVDITTDNYPEETSWTLTNTCTSTQVGARPQGYYSGSQNTLFTENYCVDGNSAFQFTINDSYGDGICCSYGTGFYTITYNGQVAATGGEFTSTTTETFGVCGTPPPTSSYHFFTNDKCTNNK
jgi:hypothetical protein